MALHPEVQELANLLREIERLLRENRAAGWADNIAACATQVESRDAYGVRRFLSMLGGMGSLNDVVLDRDGKPLQAENDRLHDLIARASELGRKLWREAEAEQSSPAAPTSPADPAPPTPPPPTPVEPALAEKPTSSNGSAYILIGFAIPLSILVLLTGYLAFLPHRHNPARVAFRPDHPLAILWEAMGGMALVFWITAWTMLQSRQRAARKTP